MILSGMQCLKHKIPDGLQVDYQMRERAQFPPIIAEPPACSSREHLVRAIPGGLTSCKLGVFLALAFEARNPLS